MNEPRPPIVTQAISNHIEDDSVAAPVNENETNVHIVEVSSIISTENTEENATSHDNNETEVIIPNPQDVKVPLETSVFNHIFDENDDTVQSDDETQHTTHDAQHSTNNITVSGWNKKIRRAY